jgi:CubicO group peptidase (beta-lactamase class C family)
MRFHLLWTVPVLLTSCSSKMQQTSAMDMGTAVDMSTPTSTDMTTSCVPPTRATTIAAAVDTATMSVRADPSFVGLAVGVIDQGTVYTQYYGQAILSPTPSPMSSASILRIGSLTKTFTATLLADLAVRGDVAVGIAPGDPPETKVVDPLCSPPPSRAAITLGQLASHYSGLPDSIMPGPPDEASVWMHFCQDPTTYNMPGAAYLYSNYGYDLLGYDCAARLSQPTWEAAVQATITDPLGMPDTRTLPNLDSAQLARVAEDYSTADGGTIVPMPGNSFAPGDNPAGALLSTLPDQMTWLAFNMREGNDVCSPTDKVCLLSRGLGLLRLPRGPGNSNAQIALAWQVQNLECGHPYYWKGGAVDSYRAFIAYTIDPAKRGVVVMFNYVIDDRVMENLVANLLKSIP